MKDDYSGDGHSTELDELEEAFWESLKHEAETEAEPDTEPEKAGQENVEQAFEKTAPVPEETVATEKTAEPEKVSASEEAAVSEESVASEEDDSAEETPALAEENDTEDFKDSSKTTEDEPNEEPKHAANSGKKNRYALLEEEEKRARENDPLNILAESRPYDKIEKELMAERKIKRKKTIRIVVVILIVLALIIGVLFLLWKKSRPIGTYLNGNGELWMVYGKENDATKKLAGDVREYIGGNVGAERFFYVSEENSLIYMANGKQTTVISDRYPYEAAVSPDGTCICYDVYDAEKQAYDAYIWRSGMTEPYRMEYIVSNAGHFIFSEDSQRVYYDVATLSENYIVKQMECEQLKKETKSGYSASSVFCAGEDYFHCYDVTRNSGEVIFYAYLDRMLHICKEGEEERTIAEEALNRVEILEEEDLAAVILEDGRSKVYSYRDGNITQAEMILPDGETAYALEWVYDCKENPQMLVAYSKTFGSAYGILFDDLKRATEKGENAEMFCICKAQSISNLMFSDGRLYYLTQRDLYVSEVMTDEHKDASFTPSYMVVSTGNDTDFVTDYAVNKNGTTVFVTSGKLYRFDPDNLLEKGYEKLLTDVKNVELSAEDSTSFFCTDYDENLYLFRNGNSEGNKIAEKVRKYIK